MDGPPPEDRAARPLYHLHIPHSAGTSLNQLLEARFRRDDIFASGLLPSLLDTPADQLRRFRLFRGHFGLVLPARLDWELRTLTVLRHPVEQALSLFGFMRRHESHYFHHRVNVAGYGISEFLRDPVCQPLIQNHVARFLAFEPTEDDWAWAAPLEPSDPRFRQAVFELCPLRLSEEGLFEGAAATLQRLDVVGITEQLDKILVLLAHAMGWPPLGPPALLNAAPTRLYPGDLHPEDLARLRALKALDLELYDLATRRFATDLELLPSELLQGT